MKQYIFDVETVEAGQRGPYQDSYYHYKITTVEPEWFVKSFCMNVLKKSFVKKDMPDPFVGELLEFKKLTNNNDGGFLKPRVPETYQYRVKTEYTG